MRFASGTWKVGRGGNYAMHASEPLADLVSMQEVLYERKKSVSGFQRRLVG